MVSLMKGGYKTEVQTMRALAKLCEQDKEVILIIDFSNAFNAYNRNWLVKLSLQRSSEKLQR